MDTKDEVLDTINVSEAFETLAEVAEDKELDNNDVKNESKSSNIEESNTPKTESTALVVVNSGGLIVAQNMFKKSIKFSIKSFLISVSMTILNFFI